MDVTLRVRRDALPRLRAVAGPVTWPAIDAAAKTAAGRWLELVVPFEQLDHAHGDLLSLGDAVEVLAPAALRSRVAATSRALASVYRN